MIFSLGKGIKLAVETIDIMAAILRTETKKPLFGQDLALFYLGEYGRPTSAKELHDYILNKEGPIITYVMLEKAFRGLQKWYLIKPITPNLKYERVHEKRYEITEEGLAYYRQNFKNKGSE